MTREQDKLFLAIPNKGRLKEPIINILKRAGYKFRAKDRALHASCTNANINILFVRTDDIPYLVSENVVDMGITGEDLIIESGANVANILPLGIGICKLAVAVSEDLPDDIKVLDKTTIATSFPKIAKDFFNSNGIEVDCITMNGALEIMIALGLADAIVDIVETGDTLRENKLKTIADIGSYQATFIARNDLACDERIAVIKRRLEGIILADKYSMLEYNIEKSNLKRAEELTPGFQSPTISQLDDSGWVSVKAMIKKSDVVDIMDALASIGATAILETEIRNCRI